MVLTMALQRTGQRYLKALHLKDVAERFAVVDRASVGARPPELESMSREADLGNAAGLSQATIRQMLQDEIKQTRGIVHGTVREAVGRD